MTRLLDGEVVALGADGISSFRRLQEALQRKAYLRGWCTRCSTCGT